LNTNVAEIEGGGLSRLIPRQISPLPFRVSKVVSSDGVSIKIVDAEGEEVAVMRSAKGRKEANAQHLVDGANAHAEMSLATFHNGLRILNSIDLYELEAVGVFVGDRAAWEAFRDAPHESFMRADDATAEKIWGIVLKRMKGRAG
jgi:hypothetical protein